MIDASKLLFCKKPQQSCKGQISYTTYSIVANHLVMINDRHSEECKIESIKLPKSPN